MEGVNTHFMEAAARGPGTTAKKDHASRSSNYKSGEKKSSEKKPIANGSLVGCIAHARPRQHSVPCRSYLDRFRLPDWNIPNTLD